MQCVLMTCFVLHLMGPCRSLGQALALPAQEWILSQFDNDGTLNESDIGRNAPKIVALQDSLSLQLTAMEAAFADVGTTIVALGGMAAYMVFGVNKEHLPRQQQM